MIQWFCELALRNWGKTVVVSWVLLITFALWLDGWFK